jgi:hypothetical protein
MKFKSVRWGDLETGEVQYGVVGQQPDGKPMYVFKDMAVLLFPTEKEAKTEAARITTMYAEKQASNGRSA